MKRLTQPKLSLTTLEDRLTPATIYALADEFNQTFLPSPGGLVTFDSADPGTIISSVPLGKATSDTEFFQAIDFRPANGQLYALSILVPPSDTFDTQSFGRLYIIDPATGVATQVGSGFIPLGRGRASGFDFNPVTDQIRITSGNGDNLRINPDDGSVIVDRFLRYGDGDVNSSQFPSIVTSAYNNNSVSATSTKLFNIDNSNNSLVTQSPENNGTLQTVGNLGININSASLDIANESSGGNKEQAFVSYVRDDSEFPMFFRVPPVSQFGSIDLATGKLTEIGRINNVSGTVRDIAIQPTALISPPSPPLARVLTPFAVGSDSGVESKVRVFNPDQTEVTSFIPFPGFTGGVRVAMADVNDDGVADVIAGTGPGGTNLVRIFSGKDNSVLFETVPFELSFTGGLFVAAGDVNGDGIAELIVTPDVGGGPRVRIYDLSKAGTPTVMADFFGIDDPAFRGGARASVGDINNDGVGDLVVAAGAGGGPRVAVYDGSKLSNTGGPKLFGDFFMFEDTLRDGVYPAAGDLNGDGFAEVIAGAGPGGGPRVYALDGKSLIASTQQPVANFFAGNLDDRSGVRVAVTSLDDDNLADLVTGSGNGSTVTGYLGKNIPEPFFSLDLLPGSAGIFVG